MVWTVISIHYTWESTKQAGKQIEYFIDLGMTFVSFFHTLNISSFLSGSSLWNYGKNIYSWGQYGKTAVLQISNCTSSSGVVEQDNDRDKYTFNLLLCRTYTHMQTHTDTHYCWLHLIDTKALTELKAFSSRSDSIFEQENRSGL